MEKTINEHFRYSNKGTSKLIPKKAYNSEIEALEAIDIMNDEGAHPYKCSICGKWHIGHNRYGRK